MPAALLALLALMAGAPTSGVVDARIAAAAVAAQRLQGPLDGTWTLTDSHGRALYVFQLVDPANAASALQAAWRAPGPNGDLGVASQVVRNGGHLTVRFEDRGGNLVLDLRRMAGVWRGRLRGGGLDTLVILRPG